MEYMFLLLSCLLLIVLFYLYIKTRNSKEPFAQFDTQPFLLISLSILCFLIINQCLLIVNNDKNKTMDDNVGKEISTHDNKSLIFEAKGENRSFKAGEDYPPGRYMITTKDEEAVIFIRNSDNTKIVSEVIGTSENAIPSYTITMEKDWRIVPIIGTEIELTPIYETNFTLSTGYWKVGTDIMIKDGPYNIFFDKNTTNGLVTIFDKDGNETSKVNFDDKKLSMIPIKTGDSIKISGTEAVTFEQTAR